MDLKNVMNMLLNFDNNVGYQLEYMLMYGFC